ncbi:molybdenum cofactor guanylyltransferase [Geobacter sp. AOG1]|uniref:molybdenum cofactor guanylyltransferase n=1 Tax=Geobacter sp. AOG1 TaxID=1566346 RepID=UPI001CC7FC81|nr:molybdenum cofactor guanylyltransferase [Geobacter sp. AOG1]
MSSPNPDITGVILVGGQSRRMGTDKAFLDLRGRPLIERVLRVCEEVCGSVLLVGNRPERFSAYGLPVVPDIYPGSSLGGLYTGLSHASTPTIFATPCDIPFPNAAIMRHLISCRDDYDAVVPLTTHGVEPLFAIYTKACLEPMRRMLEAGNVRIHDLYSLIRIRYVETAELASLDPFGTAFLNLNTPDDYEKARGKE